MNQPNVPGPPGQPAQPRMPQPAVHVPPPPPPPPPGQGRLSGWVTPEPPLVIDHRPAQGSSRDILPGHALLFSTSSGTVEQVSGPPGLWGWPRRYRYRYVVDLGEHSGTLFAEVPSSGVASFQLRLDVFWRVHDPVAIVSKRIDHPHLVLETHLVDNIRAVSSTYAASDERALEQYLVGTIGRRPQRYDEGLMVVRASIKVARDATRLDRAEQEDALEFEERIEDRKVQRLRQDNKNEDDLIFLHLARNPGDVHGVINDLRNRREMDVRAKLELFNQLVDKGFIQEADVSGLRQSLLEPIVNLAGPARTTLDSAPRPAELGASAPTPEEEEDVIPPKKVLRAMPEEEDEDSGVVGWSPPPWAAGDQGQG